MAFKLDSKIPAGELAQKWSNHKAAIKVVSPANIFISNWNICSYFSF